MAGGFIRNRMIVVADARRGRHGVGLVITKCESMHKARGVQPRRKG